MSRVLIDTSLYVHWFRGRHPEVREEARFHIVYAASVVMAELYAGARNPGARRAADRYFATFSRLRRLLPLSPNASRKAGLVLAHLEEGSHRLLADTLIAMTALEIGAELWTTDAVDFERIRSVQPFRLRVVS